MIEHGRARLLQPAADKRQDRFSYYYFFGETALLLYRMHWEVSWNQNVMENEFQFNRLSYFYRKTTERQQSVHWFGSFHSRDECRIDIAFSPCEN